MSKMKKPKSLRPPMPIVTPSSSLRSEENDRQFELELCWCVQQLENALNSGKLSQKVADDTMKNIKILKGNTAPIIKKRQVMKASMGDYRTKMKEEEKKMALAAKQIKFTPSSTDDGKKSSFVKKAAILSSGKDFKFNFITPAHEKGANGNLNEEAGQNDVSTAGVAAPNEPSTKQVHFTTGSDFKFNFAIDEVNDEIRLDELSLKN